MKNKIIVETSARHVHVSRKDLDILFGEGYELTHKKDLSQPGQYACEERVTIKGEKGELKNVIILGPTRPDTQVELSKTDARSIGINAPIRESGDIEGSSGCTLIGPNGSVVIEKGVIVAKRHLHITPEFAQKINKQNNDIVSVVVETEGRSLMFGDVVVRVSEKFAQAMHIDTDEANAANIAGNVEGEII